MPEDVRAASRTPAAITKLPPELIDHLLTHVPPEVLQRTALSLIQVFPDYGLSSRHLWTHLTVHRSKQLLPLWRRLQQEQKKDVETMIDVVKTFCMKSWTGDADILNNVLRCLPSVPTLLLNIGTNFAPEHLEEVFEDPRTQLRRLEVRFRPYVEQASYYQFLKGSYFDSAVETMYKEWPESECFTHLSLIQDIPPRRARRARQVNGIAIATPGDVETISSGMAQVDLEDDHPALEEPHDETAVDSMARKKQYTGHGPFPFLGKTIADARPRSFAQPIVFFDIKCLWRFGAAPVARHLTHLRLRIPSRDVASVLILHHTPGYSNSVFPALKYLDISTTNVRLDTVLSTLLKSYTLLEHLVLDRTNIFGFGAGDKGSELCKDLGSLCVSSGLARGKERERRIALWDSTERARIAQLERVRRQQPANDSASSANSDNSDGNGEDHPDQADRAGESETQQQLDLARARRGHRSAAQANFSLRDRPRRTGVSSQTTAANANLPPTDRAYFVLPPLPRLRTVSIGGEAHALPQNRIQEWENQFQAGWHHALERLSAWAEHTAERYERAKRKADDWRAKNEDRTKITQGKGKRPVNSVKLPLDVKLFQFPLDDEAGPLYNQDDPTIGLTEIHPVDRSYLDPYLDAVASSGSHLSNPMTRPSCVLCNVPDCEGPSRRGAEGEKVDESGGMSGEHRKGCGHLEGRTIWGWQQS